MICNSFGATPPADNLPHPAENEDRSDQMNANQIRALTQLQCNIRMHFLGRVFNGLYGVAECNDSIDSNEGNIIGKSWCVVATVMIKCSHIVTCSAFAQINRSNHNLQTVRILANDTMCCRHCPFTIDYRTATEMESSCLHRTLIRCVSVFCRVSADDSGSLWWKHCKRESKI